MIRIASLAIVSAVLFVEPASAASERCRKACAGWKPACVTACERGEMADYKQREKKRTHCMANNTTGTAARECLARQRRIDMHGR
jgi:hypothetical protein